METIELPDDLVCKGCEYAWIIVARHKYEKGTVPFVKCRADDRQPMMFDPDNNYYPYLCDRRKKK